MGHSQSRFHLCHWYLSGMPVGGDRPLLATWFGEHPRPQTCQWAAVKQWGSFTSTVPGIFTHPPEVLLSAVQQSRQSSWPNLKRTWTSLLLIRFWKVPEGYCQGTHCHHLQQKTTRSLFPFFGLSNGKIEPLALPLPPLQTSCYSQIHSSEKCDTALVQCRGVLTLKPKSKSDEKNEQRLHFTFSRNK